MIKSIYIDNFKALNDFTIEFQPLTVLIGANSVGKSTVLQALELLAYFTMGKEHGELNNYLKERKWSAKDFKSTLSPKRYTKFIVKIVYQEKDEFEWTVILDAKKGGFKLVEESVKDVQHSYVHLMRKKDKSFAKARGQKELLLVDTSFVSSGLSLMDEEAHGKKYSQLIAIKKALNGLALFDFSATDYLKSTNFLAQDAKIGRYGENLATYLHYLSKSKLIELSTALKRYVPFFEEVKIIKRRHDEVEIAIKETHSNNYIDASHLSDGMMRLLAILTLALTDSGYQTMLIEELEDGINPNLAGEVIKTLLKVTGKTNKQFIITTHNPLILDWIPVDAIQYLYRSENGQTQVKTLKDSAVVVNNLDYMNPGEIWLNFKEEELTN